MACYSVDVVIDRYIFRLWLMPFIAFLGLTTGVLLLGRTLRVLGLVVERGVEWSVLASMLMAILPYFLVLTLPMAFFFAMQNVITRLHQDSEMDAFRAAGLSYPRLLRSLGIVAIILFAFLLYTAMEWMPMGQRSFQTLLYAVQESKATPGFTPQRFANEIESMTVYIQGEDEEGVLQGFMLEDNRPGGPVIYLAETAKIERSGRNLLFRLTNGTRLEGKEDKLRALSFEQYDVSINAGDLGLGKMPQWRNRIFEMGIAELWNHRKTDSSSDATAEWHRRFVLPSTILVLMLFALPLSLEPKRSGKAGAYLLGGIAILLVYNVEIVLHRQAADGNLAWWGMWVGQALMAAIGLHLTHRAITDNLPSWLNESGEYIYLIHHRLQHWLAERRR